MEITQLGRTGLKVSRLCLGTMNFGPRTPEGQAHEIMTRALDAEVSFFDTADIYGPNGLTEEIVGRWLAKDGHRDQVVLATKLYRPMGPGPNDGGLSARHIVKACEASLRRLQTDWIDIYQMHHVERTTPWEEIWQAMDVLIAQGKVIYVGSSNFAGWHIARAQEVARARNSFGLVSEQSLYNLMSRAAEHEVLPGLPVLRHRRHPVEPAEPRCPGRHPQEPVGRAAGERRSTRDPRRASQPDRAMGGFLCRVRGGTGGDRDRVAAASAGRHRPYRRAGGPGSPGDGPACGGPEA